ncbi:MAG: hypothetical protein P4M14_06050 [Gammaproteobacteria bacterium]|nr:hypothetical protein [Gammaproteobacteria bacterium]
MFIDGFQNGQHGEGFKEVYHNVKDAITKGVKIIGRVIAGTPVRKGFSPSIRALVEKYKNNKITNIKIYREPIKSIINSILNWVTAGTFQQNLKDLGYDKAFHLFMYVTLDNGVIIRFEKNHIIEFRVEKNHHDKAEVMNVPNVHPMFISDFLNKGIDSVGPEKYFTYDSRSTNCQNFIMVNLKANGLLTPELQKFILQDAESIYKGLGLLGEVNKKITVAAKSKDLLL